MTLNIGFVWLLKTFELKTPALIITELSKGITNRAPFSQESHVIFERFHLENTIRTKKIETDNNDLLYSF